MSRKWFVVLALVALVLPLALTGCKSTTPTPEAPKATEAPAATKAPAATEAPTEAAPESPLGVKPEDLQGVTITFWHVWSRGTGEQLQKLVDEFNATNEWGITVVAENQGGYDDMFNKMNAAIQSGELPDITVGYQNQAAAWDQAGDIIADLNPYINDPVYGLSEEEVADFLPIFWEQDVMGDKRMGIPAQRSGQFMFYNVGWAKELGFDKPPVTPEEFQTQVCAAAEANNNDDNPDNDGTGGYIYNAGASVIAGWVWAFGGDIVDAEGKYTLNTPEMQKALEYLYDLKQAGCAWQGVNRYPNPEFATRQALVTTSSIAGIPYQAKAMQDEGSTDEWTLIPFPATGGKPVMDIYGPSFFVVKSTPEKQLASWLFLKWFTAPENQAKWVMASGYFPTRSSTVDYLQDYLTQNPQYAAGFNAVFGGEVELKFEPRDASWNAVRGAIFDTISKVFAEDFTKDQIPALLEDLQKQADELYAEYH